MRFEKLIVSLILIFVCGCHASDGGQQSDNGNFNLLSKDLSPDGHWEALTGSQNYAGGFGTGSFVKSVYIKRLTGPSVPVKVMELSEDENGDDIKLSTSWESANKLFIRYSGGIIDIQTIKYGGLIIDSSEGTVSPEKKNS